MDTFPRVFSLSHLHFAASLLVECFFHYYVTLCVSRAGSSDRSKPPDDYSTRQSRDVALIPVCQTQLLFKQGKVSILTSFISSHEISNQLSHYWSLSLVTLCLFQMSTTTENGMGGPWNTSREKTYKKVNKKNFDYSYKSLTVFGFMWTCFHNIYCGMPLFGANKSRRP